MPIGKLIRESPSLIDTLRAALTAEWKKPGTDPYPVIIEDTDAENRFGNPFGRRPTTHLYVIWDAWEDLEPGERSEIIMDAYEATHELSDVVRVTVARGLTPADADKIHLAYRTTPTPIIAQG